MAEKKSIAIPPAVQQRITAAAYQADVLTAQVQGAQGALQGILGTARDLLGVPQEWVLNDPARGFEPPPTQPPAQPENEAAGVTVAKIED